ncbi:hypothetical protein MYX84_08205 [Acidobacteria bacterium AH-259-O06]|nr:hypothetical protein [Acidobacteria bacterium AH-259-O06]
MTDQSSPSMGRKFTNKGWKVLRVLAWILVGDLLILVGVFLIGTAFLPVSWPALVLRDGVSYVIPRVFNLYRGQFRDGPMVLGYADRHSVRPGESFHVMLSTRDEGWSFTGHMEVFRIGWEGPDNRRYVFSSPPVRVGYTESLGTVFSTGCNWPVFATITPDPSWQSGYYTIDFVDSDGRRISEVAYIVVLNPQQDGDIVVLVSTATYQAYNQWGGFSLYSGALGGTDKTTMVSFDRPTISQFHTWEFYYVIWVEAQGYKVDYITNFDLYRDRAWAEKYPLFIVLGHNEYWSKEEFDYVEKRIFTEGKDTLFLGANLAYWQVRYLDINQSPGGEFLGRQMVCHKLRRDPIRDRADAETARYLITDRFRSRHRRPESMLMGVMYELDFRQELPWLIPWSKQRFPVPGKPFGSQLYPYFQSEGKPYFPEYHVVDNSLPFFDGTGLEKGESVGGIIGYEYDNRNPMPSMEERPIFNGQRQKYDLAEDWKAGVSLNEQIPPEDIKLVFHGNAIDAYGRTGLAEAVYFEAESGAKVFSAGTIRWPWGLSKNGFVNEKFKKLNLNLIQYMLDSGRK